MGSRADRIEKLEYREKTNLDGNAEIEGDIKKLRREVNLLTRDLK